MSIAAVTRAETFRMLWGRTGLLAASVPAAVGVLRLVVGRLLTNMELARQTMTGTEAASGAPANGFGAVADGLLAGGAALAWVCLFAGCRLLVREREIGSLALAFLAQPRWHIVIGKSLALGALWLASATLLLVSVLAGGAVGWDLGAIVEDGFVMATAAELWRDLALGFAAGLPAPLACGVLGLVCSALASSTAAAVAAGAGVLMIGKSLLDFLSLPGPWMFARYVPLLGEASPLGRLTDVARAYSDAAWRSGELLVAGGIPAAEATALVLVAVLVITLRRAAA